MASNLSKKLGVVSFVLMVLVVFLHAHLLGYVSGNMAFVQKVITGEVTRIAVPLFFTISGFLFFRNYASPAKTFFVTKIKRRFYSLFVPYVLFSVLGFVFTFCSAFCFQGFVSGANKHILDSDLSMVLFAIFLNPVGTYQLWFIRDLFILVLLSPCVYLVVRWFKSVAVISLFCVWVSGVQCFVHVESIFFFTAGSYIALCRKKWASFRCTSLVFSVAILVLWLSNCVVLASFELASVWFCLNVILGMCALWFLYDTTLGKRSSTRILPILSFSFFLYLTHEPLLTVIKKSLLALCGMSPVMLLFIYLFAPLATIILCLSVGVFLKRSFPRFYFFLTGGR